MQIKLFRSATVSIISKNAKILMDPWLTDGEYYGSWYHFPKFDISSNLKELNSHDAIYISHIHPDHCSEETLKLLNKDIPVYIHSYHKKFLKNKIERIGFKVHELMNNTRTKIKNNLYLNIFAADNCDPNLCYKFIGCANFKDNTEGSQQIDTIGVIDDGKNFIVNANDCPYPLAEQTIEKIKSTYEKIDVLLTGYGGAGPYPQCYNNLSTIQKLDAADKKRENFLKQAIKFIENIEPSYYLPFAGNYVLAGELSNLNMFKGVPNLDEAYGYLEDYIYKKKLSFKPIKINPGQLFDLTSGKASENYKMTDAEEYNNYVKNILPNKKFDFHDDEIPKFEEILELSKKSLTRFSDNNIINSIKFKETVLIKFLNKYIKFKDNSKNLEIINEDELNHLNEYVIFDVDPRLLKRILMGPKYAHWNNAEIGSHIKFFRKPDIYNKDIFISMCSFHS